MTENCKECSGSPITCAACEDGYNITPEGTCGNLYENIILAMHVILLYCTSQPVIRVARMEGLKMQAAVSVLVLLGSLEATVGTKVYTW